MNVVSVELDVNTLQFGNIQVFLVLERRAAKYRSRIFLIRKDILIPSKPNKPFLPTLEVRNPFLIRSKPCAYSTRNFFHQRRQKFPPHHQTNPHQTNSHFPAFHHTISTAFFKKNTCIIWPWESYNPGKTAVPA